MKPQMTFHEVDVVVSRKDLRRLFSLAAGCLQQSVKMDVYLIEQTLIITGAVKGVDCRQKSGGFGKEFERAFTQPHPRVANSTSHFRVIKCPLAHLNCAR